MGLEQPGHFPLPARPHQVRGPSSGSAPPAPQQQPGQPGWTNSSQPRLEPKKFDTGIIDAILGKPDSVLMKEALEVATNNEADEDDRLQALDNFEMVSQAVVCISSCC